MQKTTQQWMGSNDSSMERSMPKKRVDMKRFLSLKHLN